MNTLEYTKNLATYSIFQLLCLFYEVLVTMGDWSAVQVRCQRTKTNKVYFWNRVSGSTTYDPPQSLVDANMVPTLSVRREECERFMSWAFGEAVSNIQKVS